MRNRTTIPNNERTRRQRGNAMVEVVLLAPWIFFLFMGVMDTGFFCYAAICVENAARAAATQTAADQYSQNDTIACTAALNELNFMPNVVGMSSCSALPVIVTRALRCGSTASATVPACSGGATSPLPSDDDPAKTTSPDSAAASSFVSVTYQSVPLVPIPGIFPSRLTFTRNVEARVIAE